MNISAAEIDDVPARQLDTEDDTLAASPTPKDAELSLGKPESAPVQGEYREIPLAQLLTNAYNPRKTFNEDGITELSQSILAHGLQQPLVVRPLMPERFVVKYHYYGSFNEGSYWGVNDTESEKWIDGPTLPNVGKIGAAFSTETEAKAWAALPRYEVVAGERRLRACRLAGIDPVPCRVFDYTDAQALTVALIENLQRENVPPLEEARGIQQLLEAGGMRQQQIAKQLNRSPGAISKALGLLKLPREVQTLIEEGALSPSHGERLARFVEFPEICLFLARYVAENKLPAARLDEKIPFAWELRNKGVIKRLDIYTTHFDYDRVCPSCPYNAYRNMDGNHWCLRPDHYESLEKEFHENARRVAQEAHEADRRANEAKKALGGALDALPTADVSYPTGKASSLTTRGDGDKTSGRIELPRFQDLAPGTAVLLRYANDIPAGCTADCPCRSRALDYNTIQPVCLDPKRYNSLKYAAAKENKNTRRETVATEMPRLYAAVDALVSGDEAIARSAAILLCRDSLYDSKHEAVLGAAERLGFAITWDKQEDPWNLPKTLDGELGKLTAYQIIALAIESKFRAIADAFLDSSHGNPERFRARLNGLINGEDDAPVTCVCHKCGFRQTYRSKYDITWEEEDVCPACYDKEEDADANA